MKDNLRADNPSTLSMGLSNRIPVLTEADQPSNLSARADSEVSFQLLMAGIPNSTRYL